jgi:hypothetical protein
MRAHCALITKRSRNKIATIFSVALRLPISPDGTREKSAHKSHTKAVFPALRVLPVLLVISKLLKTQHAESFNSVPGHHHSKGLSQGRPASASPLSVRICEQQKMLSAQLNRSERLRTAQFFRSPLSVRFALSRDGESL